MFFIKEYLTFITIHPKNMTNAKNLNILAVKEQITILRNNLKKNQLSVEEKTLIKTLIDLNFVGFIINDFKKQYF